jgi:hypothetical protein
VDTHVPGDDFPNSNFKKHMQCNPILSSGLVLTRP